MCCSRWLVLTLFLSSFAVAADQSPAQVVRWSANAANCNLRQGDDGHTYYEIKAANVEITLAVDSRELEKLPHRAMPMLSVLLTFHLSGPGQFAIRPHAMFLQFVKHRNVTKTSLDPDTMLADLQQNVDDLTYEVEHHELKHHPEEKQQKEQELQSRLKDYTDMMDFISTRALRTGLLSPSAPAANGWVFFGIKDRWIGPLKKPERFVLRIPGGGNSIFEFPFSLPPESAKVELRRRPE